MDLLMLFTPPLLIAGALAAGIARTGLRARHDVMIPDGAAPQLDLLLAENGRLTSQIGRLEERLASLERGNDLDRRAATHSGLR